MSCRLVALVLAVAALSLLRYAGAALVPVLAVLVWRRWGWRWAAAVVLAAGPTFGWWLLGLSGLPGSHGVATAPTMAWWSQARLSLSGLGALVGWQVGGGVGWWLIPLGAAVLVVLVWSACEGSRPAMFALALFAFLLVGSGLRAIGGHATRQTAVIAPLFALALARWGAVGGWRGFAAASAFLCALAFGAVYLMLSVEAAGPGWFAGGNLW